VSIPKPHPKAEVLVLWWTRTTQQLIVACHLDVRVHRRCLLLCTTERLMRWLQLRRCCQFNFPPSVRMTSLFSLLDRPTRRNPDFEENEDSFDYFKLDPCIWLRACCMLLQVG
jgi:hypothetical protein